MVSDVVPGNDAQDRINLFWSMVGQDYEAHEGNLPDADGRAAWSTFLRGVLPPASADVLDVGTGTGFLALLMAEHGHRVTGIDLAAGMLAVARSLAAVSRLDVQFLEGDAVAPEWPDASFDALTNRHLLWTLREPERAFQDWRRLLRPGGRVVAVDGAWFGADQPDEDGANPFTAYYSAVTREVLPLMRLSDPQRLVPMFLAAGFRAASVGTLPGPLWTSSSSEANPPFVMTATA